MIVCPKVTVIVPNFNHSNYLVPRLDSIFNQTFQDFEVIILDDCSTDNSVELINYYANQPKVSHILINKVNSNSTFSQWKKGIDLAKGKYIWIAESDDWAEMDFLENLLDIIDSDPSISICYCDSNICDELSNIYASTRDYYGIHKENNLLFKNSILEGKVFVKDFLIFTNIIPNASAVLFRKTSLRPNYEYKRIGDWKFWIDNALNGKIAYLNKNLNYWRRHSNTVTRNDYTQKAETVKMLNDLMDEFLKLGIDTSRLINELFDLIFSTTDQRTLYNYSFSNTLFFLYNKKILSRIFWMKIKFLVSILVLKINRIFIFMAN